MFDQFHLIAPLAAFLIGVWRCSTVRRIALAAGFVDNPDRWRKLHKCRSRSAGALRCGWQPGRDGASAGSVALRALGRTGMRVGSPSPWRSPPS